MMKKRLAPLVYAGIITAGSILLPGSAAASTFQTGVTLQVGNSLNLATPIDFAAIPGLFTASNTKTLKSGIDFGSLSFAYNLEDSNIFGQCQVLQQFCGTFQDPPGSSIGAFIIYDAFDELDPIVGVTAAGALAAFFNENIIVLDISGLTFNSSSQELLASVEFGTPGVVPLPATLPLFGTGLAILGLFGWYRRRTMTT